MEKRKKNMEKNRKSKKIRRIINKNNLELPLDIFQLILYKLPPLNLFTCRLVCKAWNTLILGFKFDSNLFLTRIFHNHLLQCVDLDPKHLKGMKMVASCKLDPRWCDIKIANSCNGLLCILNMNRGRTHRVAILNPITNEYMKLPKGDRRRNYSYGLGFSPKTKEYKIVRHSLKNRNSLVEIIAFGTRQGGRQWRRGLVAVASRNFCFQCHGVYFNGAIYWFGEYNASKRNGMWRLNVEDEKFEEISSPPVEGDERFSVYCGVFNGSLYLTHFRTPGFEYHAWKMDEKGSWVRAFVVGIPRKFSHSWQPIYFYYFQLIKLCEDGKILCHVRGIHLVLFDPKTSKFEKLDKEEGVKRVIRIYQINSFNFHSLHNILAGDAV